MVSSVHIRGILPRNRECLVGLVGVCLVVIRGIDSLEHCFESLNY